MPSPFPGMDPYLERHWGDVHHSLVQYARDQLQPLLPAKLRARVEERVAVESELDSPQRKILPDVRIVEGEFGKRNGAAAGVLTASATPFIVDLDEPMTEGFIEIRDSASGNRVVTVIEVLSLANKTPGKGRDKYQQKRDELEAGDVSLVEIDLLRGGKRNWLFPPDRLPPSHRTPYGVCVRRGWRSHRVEVYAVPLRDRLPIINVPLRETDEDVPLDLQALIEQCYRTGAYDGDIDYRKAADPPLTGGDARWAAGLLRKKGVRPARSARRNGS